MRSETRGLISCTRYELCSLWMRHLTTVPVRPGEDRQWHPDDEQVLLAKSSRFTLHLQLRGMHLFTALIPTDLVYSVPTILQCKRSKAPSQRQHHNSPAAISITH